jgi:FlaA1/EpsC-like NDP-sugar epimerase
MKCFLKVLYMSKRLAELILQALTREKHKTRFCMVRFGNVLGSSGSVVPLFRQQIDKGGPITLTHPDIIRYFMTIPEAAQLVIQAGAMGEGGDVFVLDMGQPVRIMELAKRMIRLSGLTLRDELRPDGDIAIEVTGLRPGEKLYEELLIGDDAREGANKSLGTKTHHSKLLILNG